MTNPIPVGPEDQMIIVDGENIVVFSDFTAARSPSDRSLLDDQEYAGQDIEDLAKKRAAMERPHLLDFLEGNEPDILRMFAQAIDRPGRIIERETIFRSKRKRVRIIHLDSDEERLRTIMVVGPANDAPGIHV